jgi:hypothetical protein
VKKCEKGFTSNVFQWVLLLRCAWFDRIRGERVSEERKRREKAHFSCLVTIEIGKREDQKVGPTSFSFLLSTAKKVKRKTLIFLCFL